MEDKELEEFYMERLKRVLANHYRMIIDNQKLEPSTKRHQAELIESIMDCIKDYEERWQTDNPFNRKEAEKKIIKYATKMTARDDNQTEDKAGLIHTLISAFKDEGR